MLKFIHTCAKKIKYNIPYLLLIDMYNYQDDEEDYFDRQRDRQFDIQMNLEAIANTLTEDDYIQYPEVINYHKGYSGKPRYNYQTDYSKDIKREKIRMALHNRDQYYKDLEEIRYRRQQERMLRELEEYGIEQDKKYLAEYQRVRIERNRQAALLRLQLKKTLNKPY